MHLSQKLFAIFSLFFLGLLLPSAAFAADICEGYDQNDPTHTVQTGICYYAQLQTDTPAYTTDLSQSDCGAGSTCADFSKPDYSCSNMTKNDYHHDPNYKGISTDIQPCPYSKGAPIKCCAKTKISDQVPAAPPPPCVLDKNGKCNQVTTALGAFKVDPGTVVGSIFGILLSLSGGIAVVIIIISGYKIMFSHADPEKLKEARESLTSAIIGLLFIIFSVAILRVIGVTLLHIPGLNQ